MHTNYTFTTKLCEELKPNSSKHKKAFLHIQYQKSKWSNPTLNESIFYNEKPIGFGRFPMREDNHSSKCFN